MKRIKTIHTLLALLLAAAFATSAQAASLLLDFGPTVTSSVTDKTNSPAHAVGALSVADTNWNVITADTGSGLVYSDNSAATGVSVELGRSDAGSSTVVNFANNSISSSALGGQINTGIYAANSPMKDGVFASGSSSQTTNIMGMRVDGLAAGEYTVYFAGRNTSSSAAGAQQFFCTNGASASTYTFSTSPAATALNSSPAVTASFTLGENYNKIVVTIASGESIFIACQGLDAEKRGMVNMVQIVPVPVVPPSREVKWTPGDGVWDIATTANWTNDVDGMTTYQESGVPDSVVFDDTPAGAGPFTVTLDTNVTPTSVTVSNTTKNYTLTGAGGIAGTASFTKDGAGTLVLATTNTYIGGTVINGGTLQASSVSLPGTVANDGSLVFEQDFDGTESGVISGSGSLTKQGSGALTLNSANSYTGNTTVSAGRLAVSTASTGAGAYSVADDATLAAQVSGAMKSLTNSSLTLGTSGNVTNVFSLGANGSQTLPVIVTTGTLGLNGTVVVNVSASSLSAGSYPLISYDSISGPGSFVVGSLPTVVGLSVNLQHDAVNKLLKLEVGSAPLTWDSGDPNNGAIIDPDSGTWDTAPANVVWNTGSANISWAGAPHAVFGGADGSYSVTLAESVTPATMAFDNAGYELAAASAQSITLQATGSGGSPNLRVAGGKSATIGTNVTVQYLNRTGIIGGPSGAANPGGELIIENGGTLQQTGDDITGSTTGLVGTGTKVTVKTGGLLKMDTTAQGANWLTGSSTGDDCTLSVDGGTVIYAPVGGTSTFKVSGNSAAATLTGTLNINSGLFTMTNGHSGNVVTLGVATGNTGTVNLNDGMLSVTKLTLNGGTGIFNFNGGTLQPTLATPAETFMSGLTRANVRDGGAVIDNNGLNVTIAQPLLHSDVDGDTATDGGLTSLGAGTLTLSGVNTYTGPTTVSNGTLLVNGSLDAASAVTVESGATLGGNGTIGGDVIVNAGGTLAAGTSIGTLTIGGTPTLGGAIVAEVNRTNSPNADKIVFNGGASLGGELSVVITGEPLQSGDVFDLFDGALTDSFDTLSLPGGPVHWLAGDLSVGGTITFTNNAPVASNITMGVALGETETLLVIGGKNTPTDVDGDSMTITAVTAATSGTSGFTATEVSYTADGALGTNTFTYTVTDALGATDTKTVTVIVHSPEGFNQLSATVEGGNAHLTYLGIPGTNYALEITHELMPPITWEALVTNAAATNGYLLFTNPVSLAPTNDFYRTRHVP